VRVKSSVHGPFDSATLIVYRWLVGIFRLSLAGRKLFKCIALAGNSAFGDKKIWVWGDFRSLNVI
jgi:hypothetical protein